MSEDLCNVREAALARVDELAELLAATIRTAVAAEDDYYRGRPRVRVDGRPYVSEHLRVVMHRLQAAQEPRE